MEPNQPDTKRQFGAQFEKNGADALRLGHDDIALCIRRAEAARAAYISAFGRRMWRTLSSLWQRPGSPIPASYRMN